MKTFNAIFKRLAALLLIAAAFPALAENRFLGAIEDLPLMPDLVEIIGGTMSFDSPSGRIVEVLTMGPVEEQAVKDYYGATLPQLGWTEGPEGRFTREGEVLKLEFPQTLSGPASQSSGGVPEISVLFLLSPARK